MFSKVAFAQAVLRRMYEKTSAVVPIALGAGIAAGTHITRKGLKKAKDYQAGFIPGIHPHGANDEQH